MSAALARYANPGAELGHAGPSAPVHADPRLDFAADLPPLAGTAAETPESPRAAGLQREIDGLRAANLEMRLALQRVLDEVTPGVRPLSTDSYLPETIVAAVRRAATIGGLL